MSFVFCCPGYWNHSHIFKSHSFLQMGRSLYGQPFPSTWPFLTLYVQRAPSALHERQEIKPKPQGWGYPSFTFSLCKSKYFAEKNGPRESHGNGMLSRYRALSEGKRSFVRANRKPSMFLAFKDVVRYPHVLAAKMSLHLPRGLSWRSNISNTKEIAVLNWERENSTLHYRQFYQFGGFGTWSLQWIFYGIFFFSQWFL